MFLTKRLVSIAMFVYQRMSLVKKKKQLPTYCAFRNGGKSPKNRPADKLAGGRFNAEPAFAGFVPVVSFRTQWQ